MTDDELNEIEARQCAGDVPALVAEVRRLRAQIKTLTDDVECFEAMKEGFAIRANDLESDVERLRCKCKVLESCSLGNNLCPDHRDKQAGKPCLACHVESLERRLRALSQPIDMDEPNYGRWVWVDVGPIPADEGA